MARSPSDATRFTATGPYASSGSSFTSTSPTGSGSQISFGASAPANESPQQKIARLRAAAATAKLGHESQFDKVVRIGRRWADRTHRFTALGLVSLTVISGLVATAGVTDMLLHNRRRRNEFYAEQRAKTARQLKEALEAQAQGKATDDQMLFINRERAAAEAAEAKMNRPGVFKRARNWLYSGLSSEEQKGGRLGAAAVAGSAGEAVVQTRELGGEQVVQLPVQHDQAQLTTVEDHHRRERSHRAREAGFLQGIWEEVKSSRRSGEQAELARTGPGPLDQQAQRAANEVANVGFWSSRLTGGR